MTECDAILARFEELTAISGGDQDVAVLMASACREILGADGAAITVDDSSLCRTTLCATDDVAGRLEDLQDLTGEGPCRDAYRLDEAIVMSVGEGSAARWPGFISAARQAIGQVTLHSFPMHAGADTYGAISVYVAGGRALRVSLDAAQRLVDAVGIALMNIPTKDLLGSVGQWSSLTTLHQATGMVIAQLDIAADDALAVLRAHAYAANQSLSDVAAHVVTRRLDFKDQRNNG
ncbi:GAF and ANTAR domain-containing protein (plasmid) [Kribbella sp. CWNU-51]